MEWDSHEQPKKKKTTRAKTEETFIYRKRHRLFLSASVWVLAAGSCGEAMFFNLLVPQSRECVCACAHIGCVIVAMVGVPPHLSVCVFVILRQESHRLLHMKCYSYKAAVA